MNERETTALVEAMADEIGNIYDNMLDIDVSYPAIWEDAARAAFVIAQKAIRNDVLEEAIGWLSGFGECQAVYVLTKIKEQTNG